MVGYITDWKSDPDELKDQTDLSEQRQARIFTKGKHLLELNIAKSYQENILENDEQMVIVIFGQPGSGKSTLMLWIEWFLFGEINFNTTCFTHEDWAELSTDADNPGQVIKYEEGRQTFVKRRAMSSKNKDGQDILSIFRALNNVHFINFQNINDVENDLLFFHADGVLWTHTMFDGEKGYVSAYSPKTLRNEEFQERIKEGNLEPGENSDLTTKFPRFDKAHPEIWEEYEKRKTDNLRTIREKYTAGD